MSVGTIVTTDGPHATDPGPETDGKNRDPSFVARHLSRLGWLVFALGALLDAVYHAPSLLFGLELPPAIDSLGEFGHVVTLVGAVIIIFAVLRRHESERH